MYRINETDSIFAGNRDRRSFSPEVRVVQDLKNELLRSDVLVGQTGLAKLYYGLKVTRNIVSEHCLSHALA